MMRFSILMLSLALIGPASASTGDLPMFTDQDMYALSQKAAKSLRKCKELRKGPEVLVEVENDTGEIIDKSRFSELIQSMFEGKTHVKPETVPAQFEIQAKLASKKITLRGVENITYTLTASALQNGETLCKRKEKLTKNIVLRSGGER